MVGFCDTIMGTRTQTTTPRPPTEENMKITSFTSERRFLSNFFSCRCWLKCDGVFYPTAEHAYQAAKTNDTGERRRIAYLHTPGAAKREGRKLALRKDWEQVKIKVMHDIVTVKFQTNPELKQMLLDTGKAELIEDNTWGDTFWGTCAGKGRNELGKILMQVRGENK